MVKPTSLKEAEVNRLILRAQGLGSKPPANALRLIDRLGYVQIDTLAVVQRSQHLVMWTRLPPYRPDKLGKLQEMQKIFEYWTHAMSYVPMADFRYYLPRMQNFKRPTHSWVVAKHEQCRKTLQPVLERIRAEGPLGAKDFENPKDKKGSWWDWKPAKTALELLMWRGDLMVAGRVNFHKRYDLTERVLPEGTDTRMPSREEVGQFIVRRALRSMAVVCEKDLCAYLQPGNSRDSDFHAVDRKGLLAALRQLVEAQEIVLVQVEQDPDRSYYAHRTSLARAASKTEEKRLSLLSPFDNLIIHRERSLRIFGFDYALECYLPASKRKFGYFVMPILWNSRLVGRLDPRADRQTGTLQVLNLVLEPGFKETDAFVPALAKKLIEFSSFNGCQRIKILRTRPAKLAPILRKQLRPA